MTGITLGPGGEFDVIREILHGVRADPRLAVGPGDDATVLAGTGVVLSTDLTVEDVHFRRSWMAPEEVGHRAVMVALSDLSAMGADPVAILVSVAGCAQDAESGWLARVGKGTREAAEAAGAVLAGGDVTRSPGPLVVDVVAVGQSEDPVLRSGAQPGDGLWVTGVLGGAAGAVSLWERGEAPPDRLRRRYTRPSPPFGVLKRLREEGGVTAGLDLSDGLLGDAGHLAAASGVQLTVEEAAVPVDPALTGSFPEAEALELALTGGEDFQLLFTASEDFDAREGELARLLGVSFTRVGIVGTGEGVVRMGPGGEVRPLRRSGFDHFAPGTP